MDEVEPHGQNPRGAAALDRLMSVQRPLVLAHIRRIRARRPHATPDEVVAILERRYLTAVTSGGAAVGASSAIPAVGTGTALILSGVETAGFLEASALFAQSVTELHGIAVVEPERARTLVMALMLGSAGQDLLQQLAIQAAGQGSRTAYWGEFVTRSLPGPSFRFVAERIRLAFIKRFAATQGGSVVGRLLPFGIGAVIGGTGNHLMGRKVIASAREAFGPAPVAFPASLDDRPRGVPRAPREVRERRGIRIVAPKRRQLPPAPPSAGPET
ncbi:MAG: hypothetical protein KF727_05780 [Microbacteriaceae bacterium]|nr:hypothetical protein [Microbacteriaceae bacterium]